MSLNHKEYGHFSWATQKELRRNYKLCPCCGHPAEACDHIFPLDFAELAAVFGVSDLHSLDNAWRICGKCHFKKTMQEARARHDTFKINAVYNRWYAKAFDKKGNRKFWTGKAILTGTRKKRTARLIRNRQRVAAKKAA